MFVFLTKLDQYQGFPSDEPDASILLTVWIEAQIFLLLDKSASFKTFCQTFIWFHLSSKRQYFPTQISPRPKIKYDDVDLCEVRHERRSRAGSKVDDERFPVGSSSNQLHPFQLRSSKGNSARQGHWVEQSALR